MDQIGVTTWETTLIRRDLKSQESRHPNVGLYLLSTCVEFTCQITC